MDNPLWCEKHAPSCDNIKQDNTREYINNLINEPIDMLVYGPSGVGKTAAVRILAEESHDNPDADFLLLNISDFFDKSKKEIRNDKRFKQFLKGQTEYSKQYRRDGDKRNKYKRDWSKRDMLTHILKEMAGYESSNGEYKTIALDNCGQMRKDLQQALRRIIEKYNQTTQFILITRSSSHIIPAIKSRLSNLPVTPPSNEEVVEVLENVCDKENVEYNRDALELIAGYSEGNIRKAINSLQSVATNNDTVTKKNAVNELNGIGVTSIIEDIIQDAERGNISDARDEVDTLLIDEGMKGRKVIQMIVSAAHVRYNEEEIVDLIDRASQIDMNLVEGSSDRVHITNLLTEINDVNAKSRVK